MITVNSAVYGNNNQKSPPSAFSFNLTTAAPNDWIFVWVFTFASNNITINDNVGLTWLQQISFTGQSNYWGTMYYAKAPAAATYTINITNNGGSYVEAWAADIGGLPSSLPIFDPNVALPATAINAAPVTVNTTYNVDIIWAFLLDGNGGSTFNSPPAGFNFLPATPSETPVSCVIYNVVSSPQSGLSLSVPGSGTQVFTIADAAGLPNPNPPVGVVGLAAAEW